MKNTAKRESQIVLELAKKVFGDDLVKKAFVTTYQYSACKGKEVNKRLNDAEKYLSKNNDDTLEYDYESIVIEFSNGRKVKFGASEWAYMSPLNS